MKQALITTTIHIPHNLEAYARDIAEFGPKDTAIVIAGDMKTPGEIIDFCKTLENKYGVSVIYLSPEDQNDMFGAYSGWLPWNCIQRRNLAILYAYRNGAEVIATIDDDNFWEGEGYFAGHNLTNKSEGQIVWSSSDGWYNAALIIRDRWGRIFFPRGYSVLNRKDFGELTAKKEAGKIVVNAGLWLGEPDIDAATRLAIAPEVIGRDFHGSKILARNTKCPFNSQNTALHRSVIPAYCMLPGLGRYDDIVPSYFVKRIADHLGDYIRFGSPIVRQVRNEHDIWKDLEDEKLGMQLTDWIVERIYEVDLTGKDYAECLKELAGGFEKMVYAAPNFSGPQIGFLRNIVRGYEKWMAVV